MKKYNDIEKWAKIYKDTFVNESIDVRRLSPDKKDKILSTIIAIATDFRNTDIDESEFFTNIMHVLDNNDLIP